MARSHHRRKKNKQWQPPPHERKAQKGATTVFAIVGAIVGLGITYFASDRNAVIMILGLLLGGVAGYFYGRWIDRGSSKE